MQFDKNIFFNQLVITDEKTVSKRLATGGRADIDCFIVNPSEIRASLKILEQFGGQLVIKPSYPEKFEVVIYDHQRNKFNVLDLYRYFVFYSSRGAYRFKDSSLAIMIKSVSETDSKVSHLSDSGRLLINVLKICFADDQLPLFEKYQKNLAIIKDSPGQFLGFLRSLDVDDEIANAMIECINKNDIPDNLARRFASKLACKISRLEHIIQRLRYFSFILGARKMKGHLITVIGLDGSGKSTMVEQILGILPGKVTKVPWASRLAILPSTKLLLWISKKRTGRDYQISEENEIKPMPDTRRGMKARVVGVRKIGPSFVRNINKYLEYAAKYALAKKFTLTGSNVVADRFVYDEWVAFDEIGMNINRFVYRYFYPKPDLLIFLNTSDGLIHQRKPTIPVEIARYYNLTYQELTEQLESEGLNIVRFGGNQTLQEVEKKLLPAILGGGRP